MSSDIDEDRSASLTIKEFCEIEKISHTTFFKIRKLGYGPREMRLPGVASVRISEEARREWHTRLEKAAVSKPVIAERKVRSEASQRAGNLSAQSDLHIRHCKDRKGRRLQKGAAQ